MNVFIMIIFSLIGIIIGGTYISYDNNFKQAAYKQLQRENKQYEKEDNGNFVIMPIYPYHPHEDLKDELDEV